MPRGTRALYQTGSPTFDGPSVDTAIMSVSDKIDVNCWCDRKIVRVAWIDFRFFAMTGSCGEADCKAPPGCETAHVIEVVGDAIHDRRPVPLTVATASTGRYLRDKAEVERRGAEYEQVFGHAPPDRGGGRPRDPDVAVRRDMVESLYQQNKQTVDIALALGVSPSTVSQDLMRLRKDGRLDPVGRGRRPSSAVRARREKVAELLAVGLKPREIIEQLGVNAATVYSDIQHVRKGEVR